MGVFNRNIKYNPHCMIQNLTKLSKVYDLEGFMFLMDFKICRFSQIVGANSVTQKSGELG